jgi:hypothetical protein
MTNLSLVGRKVEAFWGAMLPTSRGTIVDVKDGLVRIDWHDDDENILGDLAIEANKITDEKNGIGVYFIKALF